MNAVNSDKYMSLAFDNLKSLRNIFIFGCSFKNDHHILLKLAESDNLDRVYIGINAEDKNDTNLSTKTNIEKAFRDLLDIDSSLKDKIRNLESRIIWVDTSDFATVVWVEERK